jgi:Large extracellular alpha-helical protein
VNISASYYAGGSVVDCPVRWRVRTFPYSWSVNGWNGYYLSSDNRYSRSMKGADRNTIDEEGRLNDQGVAKLTLQPDATFGANPTKYVVEATVTDVDEQTVSDSRSVLALPPFVLALKTKRYITHGSTINASIAAIDVKEKALAGQKVNIALKKKTWNHFLQETDFARSEPKYITEENVTLIEEREITTGSSPVEVVFKDREPGVYIIDLSSTDKLGRLQTLQLDLFIAGDKSVVWKKSEQNIFETVTDKDSYVPGDRATIILKSPYQNALALAVVENPTPYRIISG